MLLRNLSAEMRKKLMIGSGVTAGVLLITLGIFASNDLLPKTDPISGQKFGWFGKKLPKNSTASNWNPIPPPSPTPQLSKEYLYAGSRLLAVEDANATAAPPADLAVWRESNGNWMVQGQTGSQQTTYSWGIADDVPVPGDYDGDGKTDFAIYRPSTSKWWVYYSSGISYTNKTWGTTGDIPVVGDFNGDGKTDLTIARWDSGAGSMVWWILDDVATNHYTVWSWGIQSSIICPADYDGDGIADLGQYIPSTGVLWIRNMVNNQNWAVQLATGYDKCVSSDYDGDGKADAAVYNSSTAYWSIRQSTMTSLSSFQWGSSGNIPVQNDYDLDGKTDLAVWDNASSATWTIKRSSNGTTRTETFGTTGDIPVPAFYRR